MAAVTGTRRRWLAGLMVAWIAAIAGLAWWSGRTDPATVPEQRDIAAALPVLERATGAVLAAADGDDRAVLLGELRASRDCSVTPVRDGIELSRAVTVYVAADRALPVLEEIAAGLPASYRAAAWDSSGGRRVGLHADAGDFVAIEAAANADTQVFQIEAFTGCRPLADVATEPAEAPAAALPASLRQALLALQGDGPARVRSVACPDGGTARTYIVDTVPLPRDLGRSLQPVVQGATVVRAEPAGWAYRTGAESVVVDRVGTSLRVGATVGCS
jgi:hypothetical protein